MRFFIVTFAILTSLKSFGEIPVIRASDASEAEYRQHLETSPNRVSYARSILAKGIDPQANFLVDRCLELQYDSAKAAELACEQALNAILQSPLHSEAKEVIRELLKSLNQKAILRKNQDHWKSLLRTIEGKVKILDLSPKGHLGAAPSAQIEIRRVESWLRQLQAKEDFSDVLLFVNGEPFASIGSLKLTETYQWALLSNTYMEKTVVGTFAELEKTKTTDFQLLADGSCEKAELNFSEKDGPEYEFFASAQCQKILSAQINPFPSYRINGLQKLPRLDPPASQNSWVWPVSITALVLAAVWLKNKDISVTWGLKN